MRGILRCASFLILCPLSMLAIGFSCLAAEAQTGEWTWMGGATVDQPGVYGTLGIRPITERPLLFPASSPHRPVGDSCEALPPISRGGQRGFHVLIQRQE